MGGGLDRRWCVVFHYSGWRMRSERVVGSHPELLHLHAELSNRRDKRLELATRRRDYEVENVRKRRRLDEAGAWSTWMVRLALSSLLPFCSFVSQNDRDELQKMMIAETNGKKRRLERERRSIERPPPSMCCFLHPSLCSVTCHTQLVASLYHSMKSLPLRLCARSSRTVLLASPNPLRP